jgi:hypothetical protein
MRLSIIKKEALKKFSDRAITLCYSKRGDSVLSVVAKMQVADY